ncbi:hypothetical protein [Croceimicrobium hydrocarbonivorans]|uniref:DUF3298 domain-containing protein n=1 Tax=Croceimicrobium hydrocarbonivorans TaxID=2761580 RepID=A0A7H0VJL7_9FLAO|nr:hypothetical protein [Croceimicrobium hydrocarbonivorans]QNR25915.1 hypothetical protein H4K34_08740 [Croceimicrobium hydrocarbonivorans]
MRKFLFFGLSLMLFGACENDSIYKVEAVERELLNDENCLIHQRYPQIRGIQDSMTSIGLNETLRKSPQLEQYLAQCLEPDSGQRKLVLSDYRLHYVSDSLISLELYRKVKASANQEWQEMYFPISLHLPEAFFPPLDLVLGADIYPKVLAHLEKWKAEEEGRNFNERAFVTGNNYMLPFCLSADSLILYPGAEGEFVGHQRLAIALNSL